jgi:hypothetical protein
LQYFTISSPQDAITNGNVGHLPYIFNIAKGQRVRFGIDGQIANTITVVRATTIISRIHVFPFQHPIVVVVVTGVVVFPGNVTSGSRPGPKIASPQQGRSMRIPMLWWGTCQRQLFLFLMMMFAGFFLAHDVSDG